jgi:hypothetical protein
MPYLLGFACVLAALVASPVHAGAQDVEGAAQGLEGDAPKAEPSSQEPVRGVRRWHPEAYERVPESASSGTVLELELDSGELEISPAPTPLDSPEGRIQRSRALLATSVISVGVGVALIGGGVVALNRADDIGTAIGGLALGVTFGAIAIVGGLVGVGISGGKLGAAKQERREQQQAERRRSRVRWHPGTSGFVF